MAYSFNELRQLGFSDNQIRFFKKQFMEEVQNEMNDFNNKAYGREESEK
jgi:hypothetical protein